MNDLTDQALSRRWLIAAAALLLLALWLRLGLVVYALYAVLGLLLISRSFGQRSARSPRKASAAACASASGVLDGTAR